MLALNDRGLWADKFWFSLFHEIKHIFQQKTKETFINSTNKDISIKCPVILIAGEYDNTGKVLLYSKQWAKDIKSHLYIIKNAAHFSNADNYEEVNNIIEKFMKNKNAL